MSARFSLCDALASTLSGYHTSAAYTQYMSEATKKFETEWREKMEKTKKKKKRFWHRKRDVAADELAQQQQYEIEKKRVLQRAQWEWKNIQHIQQQTRPTRAQTITTTTQTACSSPTYESFNQSSTHYHHQQHGYDNTILEPYSPPSTQRTHVQSIQWNTTTT